MATLSRQGLRAAAYAGALLMSTAAVAANPKVIKGGIQTIYQASGVRSGSGLTTMVVCTNRGSVAGTIGIALYNFNGGSDVCQNQYLGVNPGETRTFSASPVASMANGLNCPSGTVVNQGRLSIFADQQYTLRFICTALLVSAGDDPPTALSKLTLYSGDGALLRDVIFADGVEP